MKVDYLRLSITDRCNLRCSYCMPSGGIESVPHDEVLTFEEIIRLARIFASLGVNKIRLTGGEPLVRKGIISLVGSLTGIEGIEEVNLTTNGVSLTQYAKELKEAGLNRLNISLDTLKNDRFKKITKRDSFCNVLEGIDKAKQAGFSKVKLNVVAMKDVNDDEIIDFAKFAIGKSLILRFIEFMSVTPLWVEDHFIPAEEVKSILNDEFGLSKIDYTSPGPAEYYRMNESMVGFIKTTDKNCRSCHRLRLTSSGELKLCLYQPRGVSLRDLLRNGFDDGHVRAVIKGLISLKDDVYYREWDKPCNYMCSLGG